MADITANEASDLIRSRQELALLWGGMDAKRPTAWAQYGYKQALNFEDFRQAYERGGAAHGAVHNLLDRCWQEWPRIKRPEDDEASPWEKKVRKMLDGINGWQRLREMDRRNMVGRFAAVIYRIADGKKLHEPLQTGRELVDLVPLYEDQIKVTRWDDNPNSEGFGQPLMYQFKVRSPSTQGDNQAAPDDWANVHPSRVQILAEGSAGGDFFEGVPLLKAGFNNLVDIEKLSGGGAESALKNSARTIVVKFDAGSAPVMITANPDGTPGTKSVREVIEDQARNLNKNQDSSMVLQGGEATTLQTTVSNLGPQFEIAANLFAASVQIPFTILFGQQTGRLASDEDKTAINQRCRSRQKNELSPMLEKFVKRMQAAGIIEAGEFEVEWPDLGAPTDAERVDVLDKMAGAMQKAFQAGLTEPLFDANELRGVLDFEKRTDDGMPTEEDLRKAEEAEMAAQAAKAKNPAP